MFSPEAGLLADIGRGAAGFGVKAPCWCGCGRETGLGKFFTQGHDKRAESALIALEYEGSVPHFLHAHGYGPQHSVTGDAVDNANTDWERVR
ncbi:hypothetical protein ACVWXU_000844 [Streptomyces sp. TE33382]